MEITLNGKKYKIDKVSTRALAEMDDAWTYYGKLIEASGGINEHDAMTFKETVDALAHWMVVLFKNQFTYDDVMDGYPSDRFIVDAGLMLQGVVGKVTDKLDAFPTQARLPGTEDEKSRSGTLRCRLGRIFMTWGERLQR